jgi:hypothetical protein
LKINKDFEDFFKILNKNKVQYLVVGGYAVIYYSEPIATKDIDIFINPTKKNSEKVYKSIKNFSEFLLRIYQNMILQNQG